MSVRTYKDIAAMTAIVLMASCGTGDGDTSSVPTESAATPTAVAVPQSPPPPPEQACQGAEAPAGAETMRSEEHTSELQSLMRISYAVFCLKKKKLKKHTI